MSSEELENISEKYPINILIHGLDDDEAVKMVIEEQMAIANIKFHMFTDQDEFIAALANRPHICFIDYKLPGAMNGVQITKTVTDLNPDAKVIMISSLKDWDVMWSFHNEAGGWKWVAKTDNDYLGWIKQLVFVVSEAVVFFTKKLTIQMEIERDREASRQRKQKKRENRINVVTGE